MFQSSVKKWEKGLVEKGIIQGKIADIERMLKRGYDWDFITDITEITEEQYQKYKKRLREEL